MDDVIFIGSSICQKMATKLKVASYKFSTLNKKTVMNMRMNASQFNEKKRVLLFLNTNTLLPTKKLYKGKGKSHTHRTRRVARPN